jgi:tetratricopeptide (TPR) repeat protein
MESDGVKKNHFHRYLILVSFVILLLPLPLAGQWSNMTIEKVCKNKTLSNYFQRSYQNISQNLDSACFYGERGLALAIRADNAPASCLGYILLARTYLLTPDYTKALEYMDVATTMNNKSDVPELDAYIKYVKAVKNMMLGKQQEAIEETTESVRIYERLRDTSGMVSLYKFIGNLYLQSRDAPDLLKAKKNFFRALELQILKKDWERLGGIYGIIGSALIMENNLDSANIYYLKAIQYDIRYNKHIWLATDYMRLGDIKMAHGQFDSAEYYMRLAGKYFSHPNDQALQLLSLGKVKKMRKEYREAMNLFTQAYDLTKNNNLQPALLSVINELAATAEVKGDPITALKYMKE